MSEREPEYILSHDIYYGSEERFALQALIDALYRESDQKTFDLFARMIEEKKE